MAEMQELRPRLCRWCSREFFVCSSCDRGVRYCTTACSTLARRRSVQRARRKHRRSPEGRADHRDAERARRARRRVGDHRGRTLADDVHCLSADQRSGPTPAIRLERISDAPKWNVEPLTEDRNPEARRGGIIADAPASTDAPWNGRTVSCSRCGCRLLLPRTSIPPMP